MERVRWKSSAFSPQPLRMPRIVAPRASALSSDSSTSAAEPSARTKPSRSLENGLEAFSGMSLLVDSADSSEKRISASAVAEPSAPIDSARSAFAAPDRLDAELDRGSAGGAGGRKRDRQAARAETVGQPVGDRAELRRLENVQRLQAAADGQEPLDSLSGSFDRIVEREAVAPVQLDRRRGEEQRAAEIAVGEAGLVERLARRGFGQFVGEGAGPLVARRQGNRPCRRCGCSGDRPGSG